jgi:hypothetical protein
MSESGKTESYGSEIAAGVTGTALVISGGIESGRDIKWPLDPEVVARQDASKRKIGQGVSSVGGTMVTAGLTFPPYGLILSGAGAIVMGIGTGLVAGYSRDPVKTATRNAFLHAGKTKAYAREMSDLIGLGPAELQNELALSAGKTGGGNREREQAARDLLNQSAVNTANRTANYLIAKNQTVGAKAAEEGDQRRMALIFAVVAVLAILIIGGMAWRK